MFSFNVKDKYGAEVDLDATLNSVRDRIIVLEESMCAWLTLLVVNKIFQESYQDLCLLDPPPLVLRGSQEWAQTVIRHKNRHYSNGEWKFRTPLVGLPFVNDKKQNMLTLVKIGNRQH